MTDKDPHRKENEQKPEDYFFMKETIKRRPLNIRFYLKRALTAAVGGVLFGCCAAVAFVLICPAAAERLISREDISLSGARPGPVGTGDTADSGQEDPASDPAQGTDGQEDTDDRPDIGNDPEEENKEQEEIDFSSITIYENVYQDALEIAERPMKAMVRVAGISEDSDLLDDSFLTYGVEEGVVFLNSETDLYILTNYKGLESADVVRVTFCNGKAVEGLLCKADSRTGMAVVRVPLNMLTQEDLDEIYVASLSDSYSLSNERPVIAIGSPSGDFGSVIYGLITSVSGRMTVADCEYALLGTNIMGSSESSGVLLNLDGDVVGMIVRTKEDENILKAVSIAQLRPLIESLSNGEQIRYLGIRGSGISAVQAESMEIPRGIYVNGVETDSPAMIAGVQNGDIITELNGKEVKDMQSYMTELQKLPVGSEVKVKVRRRGAERRFVEIEYTLMVEQK